jgi:hypothetical protein
MFFFTRSLSCVLLSCVLAAPTTAQTKAETSQEALAKIERDFATMQVTKDEKLIGAVAARMADDFFFYDLSNGGMGSKSQLLASIRSARYIVASMNFPPFIVRIFGSTGIVQGVNDSTGTIDGHDAGGTFVWFDVFEKRDGHWMWISSQSSKVGEAISPKLSCPEAMCRTHQAGFSLKRKQ